MSGVTASRIAFVTDGGPAIGLGHLSRCAALCRAAVADGARASLLVPDPTPFTSPLRGVPAEIIQSAWLDDPVGLREMLDGLTPDIIVVDSYAATAGFLAALRAMAQVVAIDDMADRPLPVDVVVNGGAGAEQLIYARRPDTVYLLGPAYALLDPSFAGAPSRAPGDRVRRVLVSLGGAWQQSVVLTALAAVDRALDGCLVDLVISPFGTDALDLDDVVRSARNRVVVHRGHFGLRDLMLDADIAVSAAGVTLLELAATGTPMVAITLADNQQPNYDAFTRARVALGAGGAADSDMPGAIETCVRRLAANGGLRTAMSERGRALVDGQGAQRVARLIGREAASRRTARRY